MTFGICDVRGFSLKQILTPLTLWILYCVFEHSCAHGQRSHVQVHTCIWTSEFVCVCMHSLSPGLCFSCDVSPIGHGLYLARRSQPNSVGDVSERREPGRRSTWWLRCAVSRITRTEPAVMLVEGAGRGRAETTSQSNPNTLHENTSYLFNSVFSVVPPFQKFTRDKKKVEWFESTDAGWFNPAKIGGMWCDGITRCCQKCQNWLIDWYIDEGKRAMLVVWQSQYALYHVTPCNMQLQHPEFKFSLDLCCMS